MEINEIKQHLSITTVLSNYNLKADKNGMLLCPFHEDKTASMKIYEPTNTFHCFSCGASGDQIEFIQKKEQLTKHKAIMKAKKLTGNLEIAGKNQNYSLVNNHSSIINKIFGTFKNALQSPMSKKAQGYFKNRHLDFKKIEAGYNSGQFHHRGALSDEDFQACVNAGLLIPNKNGNTVFAKDCVIFPLKNKASEIVSLYGRSIINNSKSKHYYLKTRSGLYPEYPKPETEILILTESIIDAATLQLSINSEQFTILSCYGTNGLTAEHKKAISELPNLKEIIFFFDGDKSGKDAVKKYAKELQIFNNQYSISNVQVPENEDINSLLDGHDQGIFTHLIYKRKLLTKTEEPKAIINQQSSIINPKKPKETSNRQLVTGNPDYITLTTNDLQMTVLGGINMQQLDRLRITLKITARSQEPKANSQNSVRNNIDLYNIDQIDRFVSKASEKLEIGTSVLNRSISELTDKLEGYRMSKIESLKLQRPQKRILTEQRKRKLIKYLSEPKLLERTNRDIGKSGIIGEENNRLLMYLIFTSRLRENPLHIISLGGSGTGKTYLQEKISELIPENYKKEITILSENAFYYFDKTELKNKLVLIEDMDGAEAVLYPLRELQSKKKISKTVPLKDSKGNLKTITLNVEGPICLAGTTTRERLYEDNANRSILIYLDNSKQHNEKIMDYQRTLSAGKIDTKKETEIKEFFKDIQTILRPVKVINPFAEMLKIPDHVFKPLRTNSHYLAFIETVTFYHQYQRKLKTNPETGEKYILTKIEDIEEANNLIKDVLLAKSDELTKVVRDFFERVKRWLKANNKQSFFTKTIREEFRMSSSSCNRYILELLRNNYIQISGGNKYRKGYEYEVLKHKEYEQLKSKTSNVLDEILEKIKSQYPGSPQYPKPDLGYLKNNQSNC